MKGFPNYIMIQTVSGCNASCVFCPYPYLKEKIIPEKMSSELFKKIIIECSNYKNIKVVMPYLMNEPLLDRELPEKIAYIKKKLPWVSVHILTNAYLLDENLSLRIIESGIDWVGFSLHGIESETIKSIMGIEPEKTLKNILNFIRLSRKFKKRISDFIMITFIKTDEITEEEQNQIFNFWEDKGISRISYYSAPISRAGNVPILPKVRHTKIYGCNSIWTDEMIHILSNGDVVLCCMDWEREVILGNVSKDSISKVWRGKLYQEIRKKINGEIPPEKDFICLRCESAQTHPLNFERKIQLVILPPWGVETPPLGLGIIAENLQQQKKWEVEILDFNILLYHRVDPEDKIYWQMDHSLYWKDPAFLSYLKQKYKQVFNELKETLLNTKAPLICFSVPTNCMNLMLKWSIEEIRNASSNQIIVLGGISVSIKEQREEILSLLKDKIDLIVIGEGERVISNLAERIFENKSISDLENLFIYKNQQEVRSPIRNIEDLNKFPIPSFRKFSLNSYISKESITIEWSRGCIGKCNFCDFRILSKNYKKKSPERIVEELKFYSTNLKKTHFSITDPSVNADLKWLEKVCDLIIKEKLDIKLTALAIPRGDMSSNLVQKMKMAGFYRLEYGIESGSDKILKLMGKIFNIQEAESALRLTKKAGIKNIIYFIVGFPGETEEDFQETLKFIKKNRNYIDFVKSINPLYLMAGSELFKNFKRYNINLPPKNPDIYWYEGENNFELRMERVKRVQNLLETLKIPYTTEATALPNSKKNKKLIKKPDLVLVTTPPWGINNPPLGLAYLASFVRESGYIPRIFDLNIEFYHNLKQEFKNLWHVENKNFWSSPQWFPILLKLFKSQIEEAVEKILATEAPIVGFSVVDPKERLTIELIKKLKQKDKNRKIILGGPACLTEHSRKIFINNIPEEIDYFVIGEGEEILAEILRKNGKGEIKGCFFKSNGTWRYLPKDLIKNLDLLPFPTYQDFDLTLYPGKSLILEWSRGCISKCKFCINHELVRGYRYRSPEHILEELKYHLKVNKIKNFTICDPIINGNPEVLNKLCNLILKNKLEIKWMGEAIPRKDMGIEILRKMRKAGCHTLQIGVESASNKVLKNMGKIYTSEVAEEFIKKAHLAGIETEIFILIGFPGEGEKEFQETVNFIKRNRFFINRIKSINTLHLIAGTDIYNNRARYNLRPLPEHNWHYLWETHEGNTYEIRRKRGEYLLDLAQQLGLKVMETNLKEGKQTVEEDPDYENLKRRINSLQELPQKETKIKVEPIYPRKRWIKLPYLILIILLTLIVETYLWILKNLRRIIIFPGS